MKKNRIVYPVLFWLYPVLALWAQNVSYIPSSEIYRAILAAILIGVILLFVFRLLFRQWDKAALAASVAEMAIFTYGHLYNLSKQTNPKLAHHTVVLPLIGFLFLLFLWIVSKGEWASKQRFALNVMGVVMVLFPTYTISAHAIALSVADRQSAPVVARTNRAEKRPDIYYIVLDAYGREDIYKKYYNFDNSAFINRLEELGFYVAGESRSNYVSTVLSLSSSLNMEYVASLVPEVDAETSDPAQLDRYEAVLLDLIYHSAARRFLAENGYRMITYDNGFKTTATDADVLLSFTPSVLDGGGNERQPGVVINEFEGMILNVSMARLWVDWSASQNGRSPLMEGAYLSHRSRTLAMFESLKTISRMDGDNFVFMHLLVPHPPFVFGPNGETLTHTQPFSLADGVNYPGTRNNFIKGYVDQTMYVNGLLEDAIGYILANSDPKPIIILQGDHGPRLLVNFKNPNRANLDGPFGNLNAYYFPDQNYGQLYPSITPVNSFRAIFNAWFGTKLEFLDDRMFLSTSVEPFNFSDITDLLK